MYDFESKELKSYKGYNIDKCWRVDFEGKRIKKYPYFYNVSDEDDYIGEEFASLEEAKRFIEKIAKEVK